MPSRSRTGRSPEPVARHAELKALRSPVADGKNLSELVIAGEMAFLAGHTDSALTTLRAAL